ncbi:MAG: hypothetical protein QOG03_672 [Actinomycetota bacterium]|nr:hypothetical protein [Actinomycetota bacterium]
MFSLASKLYFALAGFALATALGYRATTGDRQGELIFFGLALGALVIALAVTATAGQDLEPYVTADAPPDRRPVSPTAAAGASPWPLVLAASAAVLAVTTVVGAPALIAGLIIAFIAGLGWTGQAWREHHSFTPRNSAAVGNRLVAPVALPVGAFLVAAFIAIGVSRVLLHIPEQAATVTFIVVGALVLTTFFVIAARPRLTSAALTGFAAAAFVVVAVAGVSFAAAGERKIVNEHKVETPEQDVVALNTAFVVPSDAVITFAADEQVEVDFTNKDTGTFHNWAVYTSQDTKGKPIFNGRPIDHGRAVYRFTTPGPGTYVYVCDFHSSMKGEFVIR